jgi:hypothetical protein
MVAHPPASHATGAGTSDTARPLQPSETSPATRTSPRRVNCARVCACTVGNQRRDDTVATQRARVALGFPCTYQPVSRGAPADQGLGAAFSSSAVTAVRGRGSIAEVVRGSLSRSRTHCECGAGEHGDRSGGHATVETGRVEQQDCTHCHTEHHQDGDDSSGSTPAPDMSVVLSRLS